MKTKQFSNKQKCLHETPDLPVTQKKKSKTTEKPMLKKTCLCQSPVPNEIHKIAQQGFTWRNNSCAYDSSFVILFVLWCSNKKFWTMKFHFMGNQYIDDLVNGFLDVDLNFFLKKFKDIGKS